jgi:hypothetical protein
VLQGGIRRLKVCETGKAAENAKATNFVGIDCLDFETVARLLRNENMGTIAEKTCRKHAFNVLVL